MASILEQIYPEMSNVNISLFDLKILKGLAANYKRTFSFYSVD